MAALCGVLLRSCSGKFRFYLPVSTVIRPTLANHVEAPTVFVRQMGTHKRTIAILPSKFQWKKTKDLLHFYFMLGAIPLLTLIFLVNIFVGPAELAEIPEGYEPENWEYYRDPIKRWFSRYAHKTEQEYYEKYLHFLCETEEMRQMYFIERKVRELMKERGDYKGWYYKPVTGKYQRVVREDEERLTDDTSGMD